jgi:hypothetical protein
MQQLGTQVDLRDSRRHGIKFDYLSHRFYLELFKLFKLFYLIQSLITPATARARWNVIPYEYL